MAIQSLYLWSAYCRPRSNQYLMLVEIINCAISEVYTPPRGPIAGGGPRVIGTLAHNQPDLGGDCMGCKTKGYSNLPTFTYIFIALLFNI